MKRLRDASRRRCGRRFIGPTGGDFPARRERRGLDTLNFVGCAKSRCEVSPRAQTAHPISGLPEIGTYLNAQVGQARPASDFAHAAPSRPRRLHTLRQLSLIALLLAAGPSFAQDWPARQINIIVPFAAG